ncbi:LOW QUALITY PROTEIN: sphingomyelin phosphodiesterase [Colletotrichum tofieldiae]|nr:LOW QUALITY PROTEIN: sphingomyelin phosphodiesterase [Colletotrichum tofieldiae]
MKISPLTLIATSINIWSIIGVVDARQSPGSLDIQLQENISESAIPTSVDGILGSLTSNNNCLGCQGILLILRTLANLGDDVFIGALQKLCSAASSEDEDVCDGTIALEGPVIASSLRELTLGSKTAQIFCTTLLGLCDYPEVEPYAVPVPPRPINSITHLNATVNTTRPTVFKVAHFSDIHIDPLYVTGSNANCSKPMCCRSYTPADEPGNTDFPAGPFGDHNCGAPISLEKSMYEAIKAFAPDFAIFTGDIVDHAIWNTTVEQNSAEISMAYQHMSDAGLQIYGTIGNHEMSPVNAIPPTHLGNSAQWLYNILSDAWKNWIGSPAEVKEIGAYSVQSPRTNLRIISISTNMWYTLNFWLYQDVQKDPSNHIQWLVSELDKAEKAGERVYLVGHMPMGTSDALHDASNYFDQVINRYKSTIAAMFFASNAVAMSYIAPSMTPLSGMPAFRIYTIDAATFNILDIDTYVADMNDPAFQIHPVWEKYYSAKEVYGALIDPFISPSAELSPALWHNVTVALEKNTAAFDAYWARVGMYLPVMTAVAVSRFASFVPLEAKTTALCQHPEHLSESGRRKVEL